MAWKYVQYNGETGKRRTVEGGSGGASSFSELEDVNFTNLQNGQVPKYNSDTQKWENADESGGTVTDVQVNGTSVVNQQGEAEITSYKEVTQAEYNALPASKETDGVLYCIKDVGGADSFPPLIYSDEEREIGIWRDGKPLYQKTYTLNSLSVASNTWVDTGISIGDIDAFIDAFVIDTNTSHKQRFACLGVGTVGGGSGNIGIYCNFNNSPRTMSSLTIRYTKTTDTAGSGTWTTQGGYAHHYSTSEKVIGTWIDGKPLYEKSYIYENSSGSAGGSSGATFDVWNLGSDKVIISDGLQCTFVNLVSNKMYPLPYADSSFTNVYVDNGIVKLRVRSDDWGSNYKLYMTARYIKTTD